MHQQRESHSMKAAHIGTLWCSRSVSFVNTPSLFFFFFFRSSDVKFCSFYLSPERGSLLSFQCYVSCCGYDQNVMQGRAVSEKHVAGGSTLPGERDLTLIVTDEGWLHLRRSDTKLRSSTEKTRGTWCHFFFSGWWDPMMLDKKQKNVLYVQPGGTSYIIHKQEGFSFLSLLIFKIWKR